MGENRSSFHHWPMTGLLMVAAMLWLGSVTDANETCRCASCGAAICRAACRTDCNKCCRCCIYFEMRVGRRAISHQLHDPELPKIARGLPGQRRSRDQNDETKRLFGIDSSSPSESALSL